MAQEPPDGEASSLRGSPKDRTVADANLFVLLLSIRMSTEEKRWAGNESRCQADIKLLHRMELGLNITSQLIWGY